MTRIFKNSKPKKVSCEICAEENKAVLHHHHIIPRTDPRCTNDWLNVCVICSNCHNKVHANQIKIVGVFPSTQLPYKRTLVYEINGVSNVPGITEPYCVPVPVKRKRNGKSKSEDE
jgi:hypothetical protein